MVAGYHLIWTVYGFWLPNDPRGSSSHEIRVERIAALGELHYGRKPGRPLPGELRRFYEAAQEVLAHSVVTLSPDEIALVGASFAKVIAQRRYTCYACAILPDHVHLLIRRHGDLSETMLEQLQQDSKQALRDNGQHPPNHPVWGGKGWHVFLQTREDMERIVDYIRRNPEKSGLPPQVWEFVKPYDGWLPWRPPAK